MCSCVKESVCACWCANVDERQRKEKNVRAGEIKSHHDMLVIYSPIARLHIKTDLLQCCSCVQVIQGLDVLVCTVN